VTAVVLVFVTCFVFWLLLSGQMTALSLSLGAASAALVALANRGEEALSSMLRAAPRFALYLPWLLKEIVIANLQVARLVLHPRLPIDPVVVRYDAGLGGDLALTTLANSITLTPGTVTLDAEGRTLIVHALTREGAAALREGSMARRVGRVFGERAR
jgi:multicomponent Na+:H+ antiporter subunit E